LQDLDRKLPAVPESEFNVEPPSETIPFVPETAGPAFASSNPYPDSESDSEMFSELPVVSQQSGNVAMETNATEDKPVIKKRKYQYKSFMDDSDDSDDTSDSDSESAKKEWKECMEVDVPGTTSNQKTKTYSTTAEPQSKKVKPTKVTGKRKVASASKNKFRPLPKSGAKNKNNRQTTTTRNNNSTRPSNTDTTTTRNNNTTRLSNTDTTTHRRTRTTRNNNTTPPSNTDTTTHRSTTTGARQPRETNTDTTTRQLPTTTRQNTRRRVPYGFSLRLRPQVTGRLPICCGCGCGIDRAHMSVYHRYMKQRYTHQDQYHKTYRCLMGLTPYKKRSFLNTNFPTNDAVRGIQARMRQNWF